MVKTTDTGLVGWCGEAMEDMVEAESAMKMKDVSLW
jgi:hypothetical protein